MTSTRRLGAPDSATRAQLLDAAWQLMLDEGYAAVTSRRVAGQAGLKPQLVHYYFRTMDDLFVALFRRNAEENLARHREVLASGQPLRRLWQFSTDPAAAAFNIEFAALANHRKAIRAELAAYAEQYRQMYLETIADHLRRNGISAEEVPPVVAMLGLTGVSVMLGLEAALGITTGHAETIEFVQRTIKRLEAAGTDARAARRTG